jgi:PHP family Zn ribbon phosphoesterase
LPLLTGYSTGCITCKYALTDVISCRVKCANIQSMIGNGEWNG